MTVRNFTVPTEPGVQAGFTDASPPLIPRRLASLAIAATWVLAACSPVRQPPSGLPPAAPTMAPAAKPAVPLSIPFPRPVGGRAYRIESRATLVSSVGAVTRRDTLVVRAAARLRSLGGALDVSVDSLEVTGTDSRGSRLQAPFRYISRLGERGPDEVQGVDVESCDAMRTSAVDLLREVAVRMPDSIAPGDFWTDTSVMRICRDSVRLLAQQIRHYDVELFELSSPPDALVVRRHTTLSLTGVGVLRGITTRVTAEGTSEARLVIDRATGWVASADASGVLRMRAVDSVRTQVVDQQTQTTYRGRDSTASRF